MINSLPTPKTKYQPFEWIEIALCWMYRTLLFEFEYCALAWEKLL